MMFIEDILAPLKVENLASIISKEELRVVLFRLFADIEKRPLRSLEAKQIREAINASLVRLELHSDKQVISMLNGRFSFDYLPGVSNLGVTPLIPKFNNVNAVSDEVQHDINLVDRERSTIKGNGSRLLRVNSNSGRIIYQLCSVRRQQTALWSSYRMYSDGIKEFDNAGALLSTTMNDVPQLLYGAKKFKGSAVSHCFVWNISDVKLWKEKTAVGKVSKHTNNRYYGCLLSNAETTYNSSAGLLTSVARSSSAQSVEEEEQSISVDDLPHVIASSVDTALSPAQQPDVGAGIADTTTAEKISPRVQSSRWTFRAPSNATSAPPPMRPSSSSQNVSVLSTAVQGGNLPDSSIAVCVSCKGMDKLIHLSGLAVKATSSSELPRKASAESVETAADSANPRKLSISTNSTNNSSGQISEQVLLDQLDALQRQEFSPQDAESLGLLHIASKLPRKVPAAGGKTMHSVAFGRESRVRAASRKNLVIESVAVGLKGQAAEASCVEWGADANKLPLLQVSTMCSAYFRDCYDTNSTFSYLVLLLQMGKLEEGIFSLDFHELSPFQVSSLEGVCLYTCNNRVLINTIPHQFLQAFTIALAAFDQ